ncbi:MAG: class I SAM-dependent methyltransferase [Alphaproteobacteria bacterium]
MTSAEYEFTSDWFSDFIEIWDPLIDQFHPQRMIEIGSFEGRSATYLIERCAQHGPVELFCIDTWQGGMEHDPTTMGAVESRFDHNIAAALTRIGGRGRVGKIKDESNVALNKLLAADGAEKFDLIYIDGSHQAPDVMADAVLGFQLLKVGGLMIFDDYLWSIEEEGQQDPLNMPKPAIDAFFNIYQRKMSVLWGIPIVQLYTKKIAH